ncbi:hypothetical protein CRV24_010105 [Beauveria bassiana]|nr:hypothetical protein CRV24_010105 [Beauveria bassiana]
MSECPFVSIGSAKIEKQSGVCMGLIDERVMLYPICSRMSNCDAVTICGCFRNQPSSSDSAHAIWRDSKWAAEDKFATRTCNTHDKEISTSCETACAYQCANSVHASAFAALASGRYDRLAGLGCFSKAYGDGFACEQVWCMYSYGYCPTKAWRPCVAP